MRSLMAVAALAACRSGADPGVVATDLGEASGVALWRNGGRDDFVYVDDERGVFVIKNGATEKIAALDDLEGVCVVDGVVLVVAEGSGVVSAVGKDGVVKVVGTLAHPPSDEAKKKKKKNNKGWEGIAHLPKRFAADDKDHIVAVHEGAPMTVSLFTWPGLQNEVHIALPGDIAALVDDLSDVAVDPQTGELLLLSDESRRLLRVKLALPPSPSLTLLSSTDVPVKKDEKPEGIVVDDKGRVWVITDGSGKLFALSK